MVFLGFGKYVRADRIYALEPLALIERLARDDERVGPLVARSIKAETGVDIEELGRRAKKLLEASARPVEPSKLL